MERTIDQIIDITNKSEFQIGLFGNDTILKILSDKSTYKEKTLLVGESGKTISAYVVPILYNNDGENDLRITNNRDFLVQNLFERWKEENHSKAKSAYNSKTFMDHIITDLGIINFDYAVIKA